MERAASLLYGSLVAIAAACAAPARADGGSPVIYKCAGGGGVPAYQDTPCAPGALLRDLAADPANVSVLSMPYDITPAPVRPAPANPAPRSVRRAPSDPAPRPHRGDSAQRRYLRPGMSQAEVMARVGRPDFTSGGRGRKIARWSYLPAEGDPQTMTTVTFDQGSAVEIERRIVR